MIRVIYFQIRLFLKNQTRSARSEASRSESFKLLLYLCFLLVQLLALGFRHYITSKI
ncbi:hypothetical protein AtNW77_Chr3g0218821 [Arabidopsis thaliana]|uniref:Transmembrane protein n=4 Tax=Arabidopsis TaxID=3701 RepID=A0A654FJZ9_ARATH|nr:uncharacterized protein AT3G61898 [Arabidopsis thaliana]KAG7629369.1 hypothetical protein ISN45_At03g055000 [Arabidopsis thaliana x Arabidopsis arenosa]KAG7635291.1 hypothetical protein ISN44_As03g053960 [Arabidopsis suecica]AEE80276.1 transmembrane protein [Arabidopsis thaliana]CAA0387957.1 unnamed protein product [Arabidopsis thaliana]VYS61135.1 unnamed protein product [Arabidopsis thaliana]|eukprot:NP_001030915.1 transmembrane protein [Arabidopsis thaliana]